MILFLYKLHRKIFVYNIYYKVGKYIMISYIIKIMNLLYYLLTIMHKNKNNISIMQHFFAKYNMHTIIE